PSSQQSGSSSLSSTPSQGQIQHLLDHPRLLDPGASAIKDLIAKESFHRADAPWLDAGSSPA
ncbi:hypothetical protein ACQZ40_09185, partial [Agrobacterium sp. 16-172Ci]